MENQMSETKLRLPGQLKVRVQKAAKRLNINSASIVRLALTQWLEQQEREQRGK
jgi:predicted DNA-binding protein